MMAVETHESTQALRSRLSEGRKKRRNFPQRDYGRADGEGAIPREGPHELLLDSSDDATLTGDEREDEDAPAGAAIASSGYLYPVRLRCTPHESAGTRTCSTCRTLAS